MATVTTITEYLVTRPTGESIGPFVYRSNAEAIAADVADSNVAAVLVRRAVQ